jgi:Fe-S-cluster containining protein
MSRIIRPETLETATADALRREMTEIAFQMNTLPEIDTFPQTLRLSEEFFTLLDKLYRRFDMYADYIIDANDAEVNCTSGCGGCCNQAIMGVYSFETINLYRIIRQWEDIQDVYNKLFDNGNEATKILKRNTDKRIQRLEDDPGLKQALREYKKLEKSCALLDDLGSCRVYDQRPITCRMYFGLGKPELCMDEGGLNFRLSPRTDTARYLKALSQRMSVVQQSTTFPHGLVELANHLQTRHLPGYE